MARVLKWEVPVDDQEHSIGAGDVTLVAASIDVVTVWTVEPVGLVEGEGRMRRVQVYGTGMQFRNSLRVLGSAISASSGLVWHVVETKRPTGGGYIKEEHRG